MTHLRIVGGTGSQPSPSTNSRELFRAMLSAQLAPGLTVEQACYPSFDVMDWPTPPTCKQMHDARQLLSQAGLKYVEESMLYPGFVALENAQLFEIRFPWLAHVIPAMQRVRGVYVQSGGQPAAHDKPRIGIVPL